MDVYFENVGGEILDTMFRLMNFRSRMIVCGLISEYNATEPYGVKNFRAILVNAWAWSGRPRGTPEATM